MARTIHELPLETELWQWDTEQYLRVPDGVTEVHYNTCGRCVIAVGVSENLAKIPDELLQVCRNITGWTYDGDETCAQFVIRLRHRAKPPGYIYTPTEIKSWENLEARVTTLEEGGIPDLQLGHALEYDSENRLSVIVANEAEPDNTLPISSGGVSLLVGNINALLKTI